MPDESVHEIDILDRDDLFVFKDFQLSGVWHIYQIIGDLKFIFQSRGDP